MSSGMSMSTNLASSFSSSRPRLHADEIDQPLKLFSERSEAGSQSAWHRAIDNILHALVEVGAGLIHLVAKTMREPCTCRLTPDGLGLRLDALVGIEHATAPSSTRSERSTSMVKSTWPGVSMMLRRLLPRTRGRAT